MLTWISENYQLKHDNQNHYFYRIFQSAYIKTPTHRVPWLLTPIIFISQLFLFNDFILSVWNKLECRGRIL